MIPVGFYLNTMINRRQEGKQYADMVRGGLAVTHRPHGMGVSASGDFDHIKAVPHATGSSLEKQNLTGDGLQHTVATFPESARREIEGDLHGDLIEASGREVAHSEARLIRASGLHQ